MCFLIIPPSRRMVSQHSCQDLLSTSGHAPGKCTRIANGVPTAASTKKLGQNIKNEVKGGEDWSLILMPADEKPFRILKSNVAPQICLLVFLIGNSGSPYFRWLEVQRP